MPTERGDRGGGLAGGRTALGELHPGPLSLLAAAVSGALMPLQARGNGELARHVGSFQAAWWSFGSGLVVLSLAVLLVPSARRDLGRVASALRTGRLRWWQTLGGVAGGCFVGAQTWSVPLVGVTAFLIAVVGGQTVSGLVVDRVGLGPAPPQRISPARVAAAAVAVVGVAVAATAPGRASTGGAGAAMLLPVAVVFVCGAAMAAQQALNGVVTTMSGNPVPTTWVNFLTGSCALLVLGAASVVADGPPDDLSSTWWSWFGGILGMTFIALAAWAVQHVGVLVFGLVSVTTQLGVGVLLDLLAPASGVGLSAQLLVGLTITLAAALAAALSRSSR